MKLTKKFLNEHNIFNPYDVAHVAGTKNIVDYTPADNGRLTSRYAYWQTTYLVDGGGEVFVTYAPKRRHYPSPDVYGKLPANRLAGGNLWTHHLYGRFYRERFTIQETFLYLSQLIWLFSRSCTTSLLQNGVQR